MEDRIITETTSNKNELKIIDLYFSKIRFNQIRGTQGSVKLTIKHNFEFAKANDFKSIRTTITTSISSDDMRIDLELQTVGIFQINCEELIDRELAFTMVNLMYPYLRSQVQLISSQPGIMPIILPIIAPKVDIRENDTIFA